MNFPVAWRSIPLNPYARDFRPVYSDEHCLFLTFSNGFPLTEWQISNFFNRLYAPFVEDVYVHRPRAIGSVNKPSLFGKVIFKDRRIPQVLLGSREKVCLNVDGYPLYCRKYVSQRTRAATHHGGDE